jgi:hypothetical protein
MVTINTHKTLNHRKFHQIKLNHSRNDYEVCYVSINFTNICERQGQHNRFENIILLLTAICEQSLNK